MAGGAGVRPDLPRPDTAPSSWRLKLWAIIVDRVSRTDYSRVQDQKLSYVMKMKAKLKAIKITPTRGVFSFS